MKLQGALITEQGITFAIVVVKEHIVHNRAEASSFIQSCYPLFPGVPIVLMAQNHRGVPIYFGRQDIANFMANVPVSAIPWKEYTFS